MFFWVVVILHIKTYFLLCMWGGGGGGEGVSKSNCRLCLSLLLFQSRDSVI